MRVFLILIIRAITLPCFGQIEENLERGKIAISNCEYIKAIQYLNEVISIDQNNEYALLLRSQANYSLKNYEIVLRDCQRILEINPNQNTDLDLSAIWNLGVTYNSLRQFEKARTYFVEGLKLDSNNLLFYENIGYSYLEENKLIEAMEQFKKMVSLDSNSEKGYYGIGKVYYQKREFQNSIKAFDQAIKINPEYAIAYQNRGSAKLELNDQKGFCIDWKKSYELGILEVKPYLDAYCK